MEQVMLCSNLFPESGFHLIKIKKNQTVEYIDASIGQKTLKKKNNNK